MIKYGPTGSGKSTCNDTFYSDIGLRPQDVVAVNVDDIVSELDKEDRVKRGDMSRYWELRKEADVVAEDMTKRALKNRQSVALEMTGNRVDAAWLENDLIQPARDNGYKIVVVYPLVPRAALRERVVDRAAKIGRSVNVNDLESMIDNAATNIQKFHKRVDQIVVYDNGEGKKCKEKVIQCSRTKCKRQREPKVEFGVDLPLY